MDREYSANMLTDEECFVSGQKWQVRTPQERTYENPIVSKTLDQTNVLAFGAQFWRVVESIIDANSKFAMEGLTESEEEVGSLLTQLRGIVWDQEGIENASSQMWSILQNHNVHVLAEDCDEITRRFAGHLNPWLLIEESTLHPANRSADGSGRIRNTEEHVRKKESELVMRWLSNLSGHQSELCGFALSRDAVLLASFAKEPVVLIWNLSRGEQAKLRIQDESSWPTCLNFVDSHKSCKELMLICCNKHSLQLWTCSWSDEPCHPICVIVESHNMPITSVISALNGALVWTSSYDCSIKVWDLQNCQGNDRSDYQCKTLQIHDAPVTCLVATDDGGAVSGSQDWNVALWSSDLSEKPLVLSGHRSWVSALSSTAGSVASASLDGEVCLWSTKGSGRGDLRYRLSTRSSGRCWVRSVALGGGLLFAHSDRGEIVAWEILDGRKVIHLSCPNTQYGSGACRGRTVLALSSCGTLAAVCSSTTITIVDSSMLSEGFSDPALGGDKLQTLHDIEHILQISTLKAGKNTKQLLEINPAPAEMGPSDNNQRKKQQEPSLEEKTDAQDGSDLTAKADSNVALALTSPRHRMAIARRSSTVRIIRNSTASAQLDTCWIRTETNPAIQLCRTDYTLKHNNDANGEAAVRTDDGTHLMVTTAGFQNLIICRNVIQHRGIYTWEILLATDLKHASDIALGICLGRNQPIASLEEIALQSFFLRILGGRMTFHSPGTAPASATSAAVGSTGKTSADLATFPVSVGHIGDVIQVQLNLSRRKLRFRMTGSDRSCSAEYDVYALVSPILSSASAPGPPPQRLLNDPGLVPFIYIGPTTDVHTALNVGPVAHESTVKLPIRKYFAGLSTALDRSEVIHEADVPYTGSNISFDCRPPSAIAAASSPFASPRNLRGAARFQVRPQSPLSSSANRRSSFKAGTGSVRNSFKSIVPGAFSGAFGSTRSSFKSGITGASSIANSHQSETLLDVEEHSQSTRTKDSAIHDGKVPTRAAGASPARPTSPIIGAGGRTAGGTRSYATPANMEVVLKCNRGTFMRSTRLKIHVALPPQGSEEVCQSKWTLQVNKSPWGRLVGVVVDIRPHGLKFQQPVMLQIPHGAWVAGSEDQYPSHLQVLHVPDLSIVMGLPNCLFTAMAEGTFNKNVVKIPIWTTGIYAIKAGPAVHDIVKCALHVLNPKSDGMESVSDKGVLNLGIGGRAERLRLSVGSALGPPPGARLEVKLGPGPAAKARPLASGSGSIRYGGRLCKLCLVQHGTILGADIEIIPEKMIHSKNMDLRKQVDTSDSHRATGNEASANLSNFQLPHAWNSSKRLDADSPFRAQESHDPTEGAKAPTSDSLVEVQSEAVADCLPVQSIWLGGHLRLDFQLRARKSSRATAALLLNHPSHRSQSTLFTLAGRGDFTEWNRWDTDTWPNQDSALLQMLNSEPFAVNAIYEERSTQFKSPLPSDSPSMSGVGLQVPLAERLSRFMLVQEPDESSALIDEDGVDLAIIYDWPRDFRAEMDDGLTVETNLERALSKRGWTCVSLHPGEQPYSRISAAVETARGCVVVLRRQPLDRPQGSAVEGRPSGNRWTLLLHGFGIHGPKRTALMVFETSWRKEVEMYDDPSFDNEYVQSFIRTALSTGQHPRPDTTALFLLAPLVLGGRARRKTSTLSAQNAQNVRNRDAAIEMDLLHRRLVEAIPGGPFGTVEERSAFLADLRLQAQTQLDCEDLVMRGFERDEDHGGGKEMKTSLSSTKIKRVMDRVGLGLEVSQFNSLGLFLEAAGAKEDDLWQELQAEVGLEIGPDEASKLLESPIGSLFDYIHRNSSIDNLT